MQNGMAQAGASKTLLHRTRLNGEGTCDDKVKALSFRQNMYK
jgi:hypothetical protein